MSQNVISELRPFLRQYLESQGVQVSNNGFFSCINPSHPDRNPSASLGGNTKEEVYHCFSCVPDTQDIQTISGLIQAKDVNIGDLVYSHNGLYSKVIDKKVSTSSHMYDFKIGKSNIIDTFTDNHPMIVADIINDVPFINYSKTENRYKFSSVAKSRNHCSKWNAIKFKTVRADKVKINDYFIMPSTQINDISEITNTWLNNYICGPKNNRIETFPINTETMWLLGIYCAEGSTYRGGITFTLHRKETNFQNKIVNIIKKYFNLDCSKYEYDYKSNTTNISCSSTDLEWLFTGLVGKLSHLKNPPKWITELSLDKQEAFLNGVNDGDGCKSTNVITMCSKNIINTLAIICINLQKSYSLKYTPSHISNDGIVRKDTWTLGINERESIDCFYSTVDNINYCFKRVESINYRHIETTVVDFEIENTHTFACTNYIVHNCNDSGNIFNAAHALENLPLDGTEFWEMTIVKLASQFNIQYNPIEISEDKRREYQTLRAYQDAVNVIQNLTYDKGKLRENHVGVKHLLDRGIDPVTISDWKIGIITAHQHYKDAMLALGWDENYLRSKDLLRPDLFNKDSFIVPIYNHFGRPVGFVTRNVKGDGVGPKYINSVNTDIYRKGEILFGYSSVKKLNGPLYIVEGYMDAVFLRQAGIAKVVAIGSTVLTEEHIEQTLFNDQTDIILCLDPDKGGRAGTKLAIERMAHLSRFNLRIKDLPESIDPDEYVAENGIEKFIELENYSPFKWSLKHADYTDDLTLVAQRMIPTIASERSGIQRLVMIRELSTFTSISEIEIKKDVDALVNKDDDKYLKEMHDINQLAQMQLNRKKVSDTKIILRECLTKIELIDEKYNSVKDLRIDFFDKLSMLDEKIKNGDYKYGMLCPKFSGLEKMMDGIPYWNNLMLLAGRPSCGKSAIINALSIDILDNNDDASIFIMSIDDNTDALVQKLIAIRTGMSTSTIKQYAKLTPLQRDLYHEAMDWVKNISERLIIADASVGNSIDTLENHINWYMRNYPNTKKLFMLDNFHKLSIKSSSDKRADAISEASSRIKHIGQSNDLSIVCSVELRKLQNETDRPNRQDMQGTNKLDYDADVIGLVHNDFSVNQATRLIHESQVGDEIVKMPYIELNIAKNKINGNIGLQVYKFNRTNMQFTEADRRMFMQLLKSNKSDIIKC